MQAADASGARLTVRADQLLRRNALGTELATALARANPAAFVRHLPGLVVGSHADRASLDGLGDDFDVTTLPYDEQVLAALRQARAAGSSIVLVADHLPATATRIAAHLGVFDEVVAQPAPAVAASPVPERAASPSPLRAWLRALRIQQWLKNLLVLVPLIASHKYTDPSLLFDALVAIVCFGLMASGVYVLNDLLDIADDRHHPIKRSRPLAAGAISIRAAVAAVPALTVISLLLAAWLLPREFSLALVAYLLLTLLYSLTLKRRMIVDVVALACLYTLRIVAGGLAVDVLLSFWLLAFSMFVFLSLALVKRYAELFQARAAGSSAKARGRGYWPDDLEMVASLGTSAGYMAVLVLALYVNDAATAGLYQHPQVIWFACPLLLMWISRVWMLAHRGHMNEDPLLFAVHDRVSLLLGALLGCVFWAAM